MTPDQPAEQSATPRTNIWANQQDDFPTPFEATEALLEFTKNLERELAASQAKVAELIAIIKSIQEEYKLCRTLLLDRTSDVTDRNDELLTLRTDLQLHIDIGVRDGNEIASLRADLTKRDAELAATRKDAERYRWLRLPHQIAAINNLEADQWDAAIDAALHRNAEHRIATSDRRKPIGGRSNITPEQFAARVYGEQNERRSGVKDRRNNPWQAARTGRIANKRLRFTDRRKAAP